MFEKIRYNEQSAFWDGTFCLSGTVFFAEKFRLFVVIKSRLNEFWLVCILAHFDWIDLIFRIFQKEFVLWPKKNERKGNPGLTRLFTCCSQYASQNEQEKAAFEAEVQAKLAEIERLKEIEREKSEESERWKLKVGLVGMWHWSAKETFRIEF